VRPVELRYYLGQAHYRSSIEYSPAALEEAVTAYRRIEGFVTRAAELTEGYELSEVAPELVSAGTMPTEFAAALDDDLGVPQALALIHGWVRVGNNALASGSITGAVGPLYMVRKMLGVLGLDPLSRPWSGGGDHDLRDVVDALVVVALGQRQAARDRKDYPAADEIRDQLQAAGVFIEDTPQGPRWEIKR
jgi:cysteinyl-tRNA synthetase